MENTDRVGVALDIKNPAWTSGQAGDEAEEGKLNGLTLIISGGRENCKEGKHEKRVDCD